MPTSTRMTSAAPAQFNSPQTLILKITSGRRAAELLLEILNNPASLERQALDGIAGPAELVEASGCYILQAPALG